MISRRIISNKDRQEFEELYAQYQRVLKGFDPFGAVPFPQREIKAFAITALAPPLGALILGVVVLWIVRGFKRAGS